jgi:hypothetical protein
MRATGAVVALAVLGNLLLVSTAGAQDDWQSDWDEPNVMPVALHGFVEAAGSTRIVDDPLADDDFLLGEARFRLDLAHQSEHATMAFKGDLVHNALYIDSGSKSYLDIRQAWIGLRSGSAVDWRLGRQVLTWGTGDLLFLNDLFPKDFVSFFIGRDEEFLKLPSNTLKASVYSQAVNLDIAWTPVFAPDKSINGALLSFTDPGSGQRLGPASSETPLQTTEPPRTMANGEWAARAHRHLGGIEAAAYAYYGRFKQPTYSRMASGGGSIRGTLRGGLYHLEGSHYRSLDDTDGSDPQVANSESRGLLGYEHELRTRVTLGVQYYAEWIHNHSRMLDTAADPHLVPSEIRQLGTARLTWRMMQETLTLSVFGFVDLREGDTHWRPSMTRNWTDNVQVTVGANIMTGGTDTYFGQLRDDTNAYMRVRYSL